MISAGYLERRYSHPSISAAETCPGQRRVSTFGCGRGLLFEGIEMISAGYLERRYSHLKAAASGDELDSARDALIALYERRMAEMEREIAELRRLFVDAPEVKL